VTIDARRPTVDDLTEREKMLAGQLYRAFAPELVAARARARRLVHAYNASDPQAGTKRRALLSELFTEVGPDAVVEPPFHCDYGWNITLGAGAYVNVNCVVLDCAPVSIGPFTLIGPGVRICAASHPVDPDERRRGVEYALPIAIGENVWIAAGVVIGPGVTIGDDAVVGAGSVVLDDLPAGVVAAGNPAKIVRRL
jgi:maltose O-acetyltransferase